MLEIRTKCAFCMKYFPGYTQSFRPITSLEFSHSYGGVISSCSPYTFLTLIKKLAPRRGGLKSWPCLKSFSAVTDCNETCFSLQAFWKGKNSQQNEHSGKKSCLNCQMRKGYSELSDPEYLPLKSRVQNRMPLRECFLYLDFRALRNAS